MGVWTNGPDGRRDPDVVVREKGAGAAPLAVIECKDWNRPIGIAFIDALDSKRRDVGASVAMISSNSGFMSDALRVLGGVVCGPGPYQYHLKNINTQDWGTPVGLEDVPPRLLVPFDQRPHPGLPLMEIALGMLKNMPQSDPKDAPDLDSFIDNEEIVDEEAPQETN